MNKGDFLFVYGTLRRGERADLTRSREVDFICEDLINGEIYNLGSFPGAKAVPEHFDPGKPAIKGDVFQIRDTSITTVLDAYEGYPDFYNRIQTESATGLHVWVYTFNADIPAEKVIPSGDWKARHEVQITARKVA